MITTEIRQSDFAATYKLRPVDVKALRDKHLSDDEWRIDGRTIYWTAEAAERVAGNLNPQHAEDVAALPVTQPDGNIKVRILKIARNPWFVYGNLDGIRIAISCGKHAKRIIGKLVNVSVSTVEGETKYTYQP